MNAIFIGFGLLTAALYAVYSRGERSALNAITGMTVLKCITEFGLEPIACNLGIFDYRPWTFFQLYLASFVAYAALVAGALRSRRRGRVIARTHEVPAFMAWTCLLLAFLLYLPIFIEFRSSLLDPRYIYEQTRTGYGIQFFGSALLSNCSLVLFLLSRRRFHLPFLVLLIGFTLSKGSKGQVLTDILIYAIWAVYVLRRRYDFRRTLAGAAAVSAILAGVFVLNYRGEIGSLVLTVASYSDYNRNAALILEDRSAPLYYGRLSFENVVYSKIPRALWADKPKDFGEFILAENYFPDLFALDQGAPSFGIGVYFADFGSFAYLAIAAVYFFTGRMLRHFIRSCERRPKVFSFMMLLFFADVTLIPVGVGYFLLEHLLLAAIVQQLVVAFGRERAIRGRLLPRSEPRHASVG
ncbi:MAG: hypothetical protein ACTHL8_13955 [Burkholderiaceae bacterium]